MSVDLRHLRCLVAIAEAGTFTDAAIDLGISQAAASRTLASLESALGVRLLRRTTREVTLTAAGRRVLAPARRALAAAEDVVREAAAGPALLRIGYAWSAMGRHTTAFQRRWAAEQPGTELQLIRTNSATAGLAEGPAISRSSAPSPDQHRFRDAIVGLERRYCAMAADDPWAARARCGWPRSASASWSSTGAPVRPPRTYGRRERARPSSTPATSTTGSPRSPPALRGRHPEST
jgi:DNA-binding transcriptional LysR family regulator